MPATVIRRRLAELGYTGGITILKEYLATVRLQFLNSASSSRSSMMPVPVDEYRDSLHRDETESGRSDLLLEPDREPGMNVISTNFDIIMVNRANERLFKKPMTAMVGKKCYWEFERRYEVCPHCPGVAALATGHPHTAETRGIRDDGTKYASKLIAYPIVGPLGEPVGFVEAEEDITERKRSERLAELFEELQTTLTACPDINSAVRQTLNLAFSLEGVDFGCAYVWNEASGGYRSIAQRGVSRDLAHALVQRSLETHSTPRSSRSSKGSSSRDPGGNTESRAMALVPIFQDGLTVARILLGSLHYAEFPPATNAALVVLGKIVESAIGSFRAEQLRSQIRAAVETLLASLPMPVWGVDNDGRVTLWNRAAERVFGWKAAEVMNSQLPFPFEEAAIDVDSPQRPDAITMDPRGQELKCLAKNGTPLRLWATVVPVPRMVRLGVATVTVAGEIDLGHVGNSRHADHSVSNSAIDVSAQTYGGGSRAGRLGAKTQIREAPRLLVLEADSGQRRLLLRTLRHMGCIVVACDSLDTALKEYLAAVGATRPFELVIADLVSSSGPGGLDLAGRLLKLDSRVKVALSADSTIVDFRSHGIAGVLKRPYADQTVRSTIAELLAQSRHSQHELV